MYNSNGILVKVGRWYDFYNLKSDVPEVKKVIDYVIDPDGICRIVKVQGRQWWDISSRWIDWIIKEHKD